MTIVLTIAMLGIMFAVFAAVGTQGLWSNVLVLVNTVLSALVATNAYEPIAVRIHSSYPSFGYIADLIVVWGMFSLTFILLQLATGIASKTRVRFGSKFDQIGGFVVSILTGWVLVCFTMMTLHTAPIEREAFGNALLPGASSGFLGSVAPDRVWLATTQRLSRGKALGGQDSDEPTFDPAGDFILRNAMRRHEYYETEPGLFAKRRWGDVIPYRKDTAKP